MKQKDQSSFVFWGNRIYDWMILNFLWILTSILGIGLSVGAATSGLFYAIRFGMKEEKGTVLKLYFEGMKKHWKQGTTIWLIQVLIIGLVILVSNFGMVFFGNLLVWILPFYGVIALEALLISIYAIPLAVNYPMSMKILIKKSFRIAHANLVYSLFMMAAVIGSVFLIVQVHLIFLYLIPSVLAWWIDRWILEKIVVKYNRNEITEKSGGEE